MRDFTGKDCEIPPFQSQTFEIQVDGFCVTDEVLVRRILVPKFRNDFNSDQLRFKEITSIGLECDSTGTQITVEAEFFSTSLITDRKKRSIKINGLKLFGRHGKSSQNKNEVNFEFFEY